MIDWNRYFGEPEPPASPFKINRLYNGIYTLCLPDGSHRTFKISTQYPGSWAAGRRVLSLLVGPDNTADYEKCGFVNETGIEIWKRIRGTQDKPSAIEGYADLIWRLAGGETVAGCELLESRHCLICNRTLTDKESIELGIGPTCRERAA